MKFSILISLKAKNEEIKNANLIINSVNEIISIEHEFEEYSDIKEEQKLLNNISSQLEEFLKRNKNSVFSILKFFISAYSNDKHFDISNYELFDHNVLRPNFSNLNHTFGPNDFYNPLLLDQKLINDNYNYVTFYNLLRNPPILSLEENRFNKIRNIFFNLFEDEDYVFKVVFPKKYKVPVNWDKNKWKNLKRYLEDDLYQLMEALDINLYSSNSNLFEFQKDLILLIFKNYGVEWALEYLDNYINYLRWYYIRMDQLDVLTRFFVNNFEDFKLILEFIRNFLKSLLFWEYRDREKAKIFLDKTKDIIEKLDIKMEDYKGPDILNSYFHQYQDLFTKIMI